MNLRDRLRERSEDNADNETDKPEPVREARRDSARRPGLDVNRRFLVLAGVTAFITALMAAWYLQKQGAGLQEGGTKIEVIVLAEEVKAGQALNTDRLGTALIPKAYLPEGYLTEMAKVEGKVAIAPMVRGEPVIEKRISAPNPALGIAYLLKSGERAKTITVDAASGVAGLLRPGNDVDLLATIPDPNQDGRRISTPVAQKARVIAVGKHLYGEVPRLDENGEPISDDTSGGISSDSTVTLALPASKIGLISLLEDLGNLKIVLRGDGETVVSTTPFSDDVIMSLVSGQIPTRVTKVRAPEKPVNIRQAPVRQTVTARPSRRTVAAPARQAPVVVKQAPKRPVSQPEVIRFGGATDQ